MSIKLPPTHNATSASSPSTVPELATDVDHQLDGLHRSKPVYKCDVFSHSVVAGTSFLSQIRLPQSFTGSSVLWVSRETVPSSSQQSFYCCHTNHRSHIPVRKRPDCPTAWACCQPTPLMAMLHLSQLPGCRQQGELEKREQSAHPLSSTEWPDSSLVSHNYYQQQAFTLPEPHPLYSEEQFDHEFPSVQGQTLTHGFDSWLASPTHGDGHQVDLQHLEREATAQGLNNTVAFPSIFTAGSEPYKFPPTPLCSIRAEDARLADEVLGGHGPDMHNAPSIGLNDSSSLLGEPLLQNPDLTLPPTSQYILPEPTWSDEEFAKLFQPDPFVPVLDSFHHSCANQPLFDNCSEHPKPVPMHNTTRPNVQNQQSLWSDSILNQLNYTNTPQSLSSDAFHQTNSLTDTNLMVSNNNCDTTLSSSSESAASTTRSILFDGLSPDIDSTAVGRRGGSKTHHRATIKDRELIRWKKQGLSYKEIKARGGFNEAESTLRGRYRTLTKPKHLRVRKPEWQQKDVQILLEAVDRHLQHYTDGHGMGERYCTEAQRKAAKVPWKQVAEYMEKRGCYRYGNATVKKKYLQVMDNALNL
ncbi:hypothetical protein EPUS_00445 [Endocarpon pusillum Z07020]|uniref:Myb-like domain-containing protein n=1 Tax=Endocarpon pusillum (strain Z07020 / HMAS-L-300199) TaxID=1263415 RepID=U1FZA0_ENDPU|nr:uncharacterized protein EPUS_00445 [Endocarpon pusillum Z07020]ERF70257.1 hypothetical protein EPUS_00445 [Endocarpon pusillum Z07020]